MASFLIPSSASLTVPISATPVRASFKPMHLPTSPATRFAGDCQTRRRLTVVTRAGPSTTSYVIAFVFPLSLLLGTIFTSIKIADKLDREYLEELAINQAIREADEEDGDDDVDFPIKDEVQQPALQGTRTRNRPKREA
ncbi:hypothetical protein P3X46_001790 [Hevea brasiliensis]|uniref:High chlorophyll fluorescence 153 n=1 Tax=Hevea brasiliensis TaxID=3981 RepID=A0ABQ9NFE9_HEVBR|nr:uncharacterized protein LOC110661129 [Hevea brasiliensis]KAJ9190605.1 hypothetical protein P3X46_001790 [Hevea brasiliensis]KAJ9190606.1 hypothetical protein P3X46_001790 [Hevea brasiliensis]